MTLGDLLAATDGRAPDFDARWRHAESRRAANATVAVGDAAIRARSPADRCSWRLRGLKADGAEFARDAIARGAIAVVAETPAPPATTVPWLQVANARLALAALSAAFFGHPSNDLVLVGITGTNGKTTTSYLLESIFEAAGHPLRTNRHGRLPHRRAGSGATRTTPEAPELQRMLREMVDRRMRRLRHGGVVACAGAETRRLSPFQRRDLHQPDARPSRLPPRHGGLLPRQAAAVRAVAARRHWCLQSRRSPWRGDGCGRAERPVTYGIDARRGHQARAR